MTGKPTTPLRLLIRQFPDLAERIFDRCVKANYHTDATTAWQANTKLDAAPISPDDPKFSGKQGIQGVQTHRTSISTVLAWKIIFLAVTFNYELLDDAYMSFPVYKENSDVVNPEEKIDRGEHHIRDGRDGYAIMRKIWSDGDDHLLARTFRIAECTQTIRETKFKTKEKSEHMPPITFCTVQLRYLK